MHTRSPSLDEKGTVRGGNGVRLSSGKEVQIVQMVYSMVYSESILRYSLLISVQSKFVVVVVSLDSWLAQWDVVVLLLYVG